MSITIPGTRETVRVSSVEDTLLAKLRGYRLGGESLEVQRRDVQRRDVQRRDVRQLIALNRKALDVGYRQH